MIGLPPMFATIAFSITLLGIFSIFELSKGNQKFSLLKYYILARLIIITAGAWCYFNNDPANGVIYGKIYNWYAVNDPRGLAPQGWHIATSDEFETLRNTLGGSAVAGGKLKTVGTGRWVSPNTGATNESGFSALPGSYRDNNGAFYNFTGQSGYWWTATEYSNSNAYYYFLSNSIANALRGDENKKRGFYVRCVRD